MNFLSRKLLPFNRGIVNLYLTKTLTSSLQFSTTCESSISNFVCTHKNDEHTMNKFIKELAQGTEPGRSVVYLLAACGETPFKFSRDMKAIVSLLEDYVVKSESDMMMAFGGLKSLNGPHEFMTQSLTRLLQRTELNFTGATISYLLQSLKPLSSNHPATLMLLQALIPHIKKSVEPPTAEQLGLSMTGLQRMTSQSAEVRQLIAALIPFINSCEDQLNAKAVWDILFGCRNLVSEHREVRQLLAAITIQLRRTIADGGMRGSTAGGILSSSLYGMRGMSSDVFEVRELLTALDQLIADSPQQMLTGDQIGNALYGLQKCSASCTEVSRLLATLTARIAPSSSSQTHREPSTRKPGVSKDSMSASPLSFKHLSLALYGLKNMSTASPAVRTLLDTLLLRLESNATATQHEEIPPVNGQMFSNALYGMQGMECEYTAVRTLLKFIASKGWSQSVETGPQAIANSFYGLKSMTSHSEETRLILRIIAQKTDRCTEPLPAKTVGMALFGLQGMGDDVEEVRFALAVLGSRLVEVEGDIKARSVVTMRDLGMSLFGLQSMSSDTAEVRQILSTIASLMQASKDRSFGASELSMCFLGLQHMKDGVHETRQVLTALLPKLRQLKVEAREGPMWGRLVGDVLYGVQSMSSHCIEVRSVLIEASCILAKLEDGALGYKAAATTLFALQGMDPAVPEVRDVLTQVARHLTWLESSI